jgi:subtilisin family serine protease
VAACSNPTISIRPRRRRARISAGIVVVAAAGFGRDPIGRRSMGITSPGNAPSVLTVGASSHMGTIDRGDDTMAAFSSRGPTAVDFAATRPRRAGVGIESLSDPASEFYATNAPYFERHRPDVLPPAFESERTSMAAPAVSGTVALMLQANPALTPSQVKTILQYTAQPYAAYDALTQGAGFLNAKGAVELARYFAAPLTTSYPASIDWSHVFTSGNTFVTCGDPACVTWLDAGTRIWSGD